MANWSSYQQSISSGFRNVVQALQNYYNSHGVDFETFNSKDAAAILTDLDGFTSESQFFIEYAKSLIFYANRISLSFGSASSFNYYVLSQDALHVNTLTDSLTSAYPDFKDLQEAKPEDLAIVLYDASQGVELFFSNFSDMLISAKSIDIWDRFILSFPAVRDKHSERLIDDLRSSEEADINSFRLLLNLSSGELADKIVSFSEVSVFKDNFSSSIVTWAKVIYEKYGEGDTEAELWDLFWSGYHDEILKNSIEQLLTKNDYTTVYNLSNEDYNVFNSLADAEFYMNVAPYFANHFSEVAEVYSFEYRFVGRLLEEGEAALPLKEWQVIAKDQNDTEFGAFNLGNTRTNNDGYFDAYFTTFEKLEANYQLAFTFVDPDTEIEYDLNKNYNPLSPKTPAVFNITVTTVSDSASIYDVELNDEGLELPELLLTYLDTNDIVTLEDIRLIGGLSSKNDLPEGTESVAERLDSHANLELLKANKIEQVYIEENGKLIDAGYSSVLSISKENRYDFVRKTKEVFSNVGNTGQFSAGKVFEQANGLMTYISNKLNDGLSNGFKDYENDPDIKAALNNLKVDSCNCQDCKSGVSPLAYLADLINYTLNHIRDVTLSGDLIEGVTPGEFQEPGVITHKVESSDSLTLAQLQERFKHPFAELPANCESVSKSVCQARVTIEVLWTHIFNFEGNGNPNNVTTSEDLSTAQELKNIRLRTYEYLLKEIGTSYEEIRRIKLASAEERLKFANRIGIAPENINEFILNHSSTNDFISDVALEELFGYRDTTRNYKTVDAGQTLPNALVATPKSSLEVYKEAFLRNQFHLQDFPIKPFSSLGLPIIDPDIVTADDFRIPEASNASFALWQKRFNWLSNIKSELSSIKRKISTYPESNIVLVDVELSSLPALIELTDFTGATIPLTPTKYEVLPNGETVITVQEELPRILEDETSIVVDGANQVQGGSFRIDLSFDYDFLGVNGFSSVFSRMREPFDYDENSVTPWENFPEENQEEYIETLYANLKKNQSYSQTVTTIKNNLSLSEEEFIRLFDLYKINKKGNSNYSAVGLTNEEWDEVLNILIVSIKNKLKTSWVSEETNYSISPKLFWKSITEPVIKPSPFPILVDYYDTDNQNPPIVDPDTINRKELPDWKAGAPGNTLFNNRVEELDAAKQNIKLTRTNNTSDSDSGFGALLAFIYGGTLAGQVTATATNLSSGDPITKFEAEQKILNEYYLSIEQFTNLYAIQLKANDTDVEAKPTENEWTALYIVLLTPYKKIQLFSTWKSEEKAAYFDTTNPIIENTTWKLRKATLEKWRGKSELRLKWKQELQIASRQAIIDPYIITPAYMKNISATNRVLQLWDDRRDELEGFKDSIISKLSGSNAFLDLN